MGGEERELRMQSDIKHRCVTRNVGLERLNLTYNGQIEPHSTIEWSIGQFRPITKVHAIVECGDTVEEQDALFLGIFVLLL